jgi:hypothetical protein
MGLKNHRGKEESQPYRAPSRLGEAILASLMTTIGEGWG